MHCVGVTQYRIWNKGKEGYRVKSWTCLLKVLEIGLGHFIRSPANSRAGHGGNNPGSHTTEETSPAELPLDNGGGIKETLGRADFLVLSETTGLKKCLHDIERSGDTRSKGTSKTTGHAVGERVIFLLGVHELGEGLVGDKLCGSEGDSHAEGGRVGEVEGLETLSAVEGFGALHQALVNGSVDLHSLLDH